MPMKLIKSFRAANGQGKEAYLILDNLFTNSAAHKSFMDLENRYHTLLPRTWLPETAPEDAERMSVEMEAIRREQIRIISASVRDPKTGTGHDIDVLFDRAKKHASNLTDWERGNLRVMEDYYLFLSSFKKDQQFIDKYIDTLKNSSRAWLETLNEDKADHAWQAQRPLLEASFDVLRQSMQEPARILSERLGRPVSLSEAALMQLNPGVTGKEVTETLDTIKARFRHIIAQVRAQEKSGTAPALLPLPEIPSEIQMRVFERLRQEILAGAGYDEETLAHDNVELLFTTGATGVCWGYSRNIVLAIETYPENVTKGLSNAWHETGHALYLLEMNRLPPEARDKPVATFNGFGTHEAAAITMEQAGLRAKAFELVAPVLKDELEKAVRDGRLPPEFNTADPALSPENLYRTANRPNLTDMEWGTSELALAPNMAWRIKAFRNIFDGKLEVKDLPAFWAKEMTEWTGIKYEPENFRIGEDHIFSGLGGYFWAYMTGAFTATAFQDRIARESLAPDSRATDIASYSASYSNFLREKIFRHGSKDMPEELLKSVIGLSIWDKRVIHAYLERLSAAILDGMPAPDEILLQRYGSKPSPHPPGKEAT